MSAGLVMSARGAEWHRVMDPPEESKPGDDRFALRGVARVNTGSFPTNHTIAAGPQVYYPRRGQGAALVLRNNQGGWL
jgi:hypothetical protein